MSNLIAIFFSSFSPLTLPFCYISEICIFFSYSEIIINYEFNHATLGDLVDSVKPGGKMKNTIAEIGIYVINGKKTRGAIKCVMALHVSVSFISHITFHYKNELVQNLRNFLCMLLGKIVY